MNIARLKTAWSIACLAVLGMIFQLFFGNSSADALTVQPLVYNSNILYISKYNNLVNIKDIIYIDIINNNKINDKFLKMKSDKLLKVKKNQFVYLINDLHLGNTFLMPAYSVKLNLKSRVDSRVFISRLANAIKSTESGGLTAYSRKSSSSSACGAYQYMPSTWNNYMGFKTACDAPAWVQDQRIIGELRYSYKKYHDWRKVVAAHLYPCRANDMRTWNRRIPGNPTLNQYVSSVFEKANISLA